MYEGCDHRCALRFGYAAFEAALCSHDRRSCCFYGPDSRGRSLYRCIGRRFYDPTVSPVKAVIFLVFIVVLQQLEGNIIYPKVVGSSMGLPGIWVLAAVTAGGGVMGIPGMLLGVPLAASVYRLVRDDVNKDRTDKGV